ncbi:MAG: Fe-Mn family superoxide dismutase [Saprospiraceae bacterium]|jgi:Fe-Mn family superoxide dismutase
MIRCSVWILYLYGQIDTYMKKRLFLKNSSIAAVGLVAAPFIGCKTEKKESIASEILQYRTDFILPELGFSFDAMEPNIDAQTMEIHHDKHHAGYVRKLNAALKASEVRGSSIEEILANVSDKDTGVRNNGGGHYNHSLFWSNMSPKEAGMPKGDLADAINSAFGSFDTFKEQFSTAAKTRFGSGWAWLSKGAEGKLFVSSTPNQDNPLMSGIVEKVGTPILGIDVWEHAYYLNYQNRRGDYVANFFNTINWDAVAKRLA